MFEIGVEKKEIGVSDKFATGSDRVALIWGEKKEIGVLGKFETGSERVDIHGGEKKDIGVSRDFGVEVEQGCLPMETSNSFCTLDFN